MCHLRVVCVLAIVSAVCGKIFSPLELAKILHQRGITDWDIPAVVCVANNVSGLNSSFVKHTYEEELDMDVTLYGIFGLSEHEVNCDLRPQQLTDDDIVDDIGCAIEILSTGLKPHNAISGSFEYLFGHSKVDINDCFNWWEKLPSTIFEPDNDINTTAKPPNQPRSVHTTTAKPPNEPKSSWSTTTAQPPNHSKLPDDHPPITKTCICEYQNSNTIFNLCLVWFNMTLLLMGYILWTAFSRRRGISGSTSSSFVYLNKGEDQNEKRPSQRKEYVNLASTTEDTAYLCSDLEHDR